MSRDSVKPDDETLAAMDAGSWVGAFGKPIVHGCVLSHPNGYSLVELHQIDAAIVGGAHLSVMLSASALRDLSGQTGPKLYPSMLRDNPSLSSVGLFELDDGPVIKKVIEMRPATPAELGAALAARMDNGIANLQRRNIHPTMSADQLMAIMRGDDHGEDGDIAAPAP